MKVFYFKEQPRVKPAPKLYLPEFVYVVNYADLFVPRNQTECDQVTLAGAKETVRMKLQQYRRVKVIIVDNSPGSEESQKIIGDFQKFILSLQRDFPESDIFIQATTAERFLT